MPQTDSALAGILVQLTDSSGYITDCISSAAFPTTASKFAKGCLLTDSTTGITYKNTGTVAVPVWTEVIGEGVVRTKIVALTAAQILGMAAAPVEVIPAIAGKAIILDDFVFDLTGTATQFANGGVVNLQYKNTATGAGTTLHADIAAAVVTGATGRVVTQRIAKDLSATATADIVGIGVYISNKTAAFITGTGTARCIVRYHTI